MAKKEEKWEINQPGAYYVDQECIDCDTCRGIAPELFTRNDDDAHSYVQLQPTTEDDIEMCEEALELCPAQAIGNDGADMSTELNPAASAAMSAERKV